jgi:O-antigen ligase
MSTIFERTSLKKISPNSRIYHTGYSPFLIFLFLVFTAYMAIPVIDVPLLSLSLSAPIFFFVALQVVVRPPQRWLNAYRRWIYFAVAIWAAIFISVTFNGLISYGVRVDARGYQYIIRYAYWLLVFVVTIYFVSYNRLGKRVTLVLALSILALALLRWFEVFAYSNIGAVSLPVFLTQNSYGWMFSTFTPMVLGCLVYAQPRHKLPWVLILGIVWGAAAINGSRGSWVSLSIGLIVFIIVYLIAFPRRILLSLGIALIVGGFLGALSLAPPKIKEPTIERYQSLAELDKDKSYAIRTLMVQKGLRLFVESPIIGIGPSRWTRESTMLEIPFILQYAPQEHFDRKTAHNSYVSFLAETGLIGIIPYGLLILILVIKGIRATINFSRFGESWALGIYSSFIGMSIHLWAFSSLANSGTWLVYGLVAAIIYLDHTPIIDND